MSISRWYILTMIKRIDASCAPLKNSVLSERSKKKNVRTIWFYWYKVHVNLKWQQLSACLGPRAKEKWQTAKGQEESFGADTNVLSVSQVQTTVKLTEFKKVQLPVCIFSLQLTRRIITPLPLQSSWKAAMPHPRVTGKRGSRVLSGEERDAIAKTFAFIGCQSGVWQCVWYFTDVIVFNSNKFNEVGTIISITEEEMGSESLRN